MVTTLCFVDYNEIDRNMVNFHVFMMLIVFRTDWSITFISFS